MALTGDYQSAELSDVLQWLEMGSHSGCLDITCPALRLRLEFHSGVVLGAQLTKEDGPARVLHTPEQVIESLVGCVSGEGGTFSFERNHPIIEDALHTPAKVSYLIRSPRACRTISVTRAPPSLRGSRSLFSLRRTN